MNKFNFINSIGIIFKNIESGSFIMGTNPSELTARENEMPAHEVYVNSFYISIYPITQLQYEKVCKLNPSYFSKYGGGKDLIKHIDTEKLPVDSVSWQDAISFCEKLSQLPNEKIARRKYRLPTEEEWEYACRAGTNSPFNTGIIFTSQNANIKGEYPYNSSEIGYTHNMTTPVGQYPPNQWGLYDMHGNVWEWCMEEFFLYNSPSAKFKNSSVLRGGAWNCYSRFCRSAYRCVNERNVHYYDCGFRIICQIL